MSDREHDDELERMRDRAKRGGTRQRRSGRSGAVPQDRGTVSPRTSQTARTGGRGGREDYDEEYYYGEDYEDDYHEDGYDDLFIEEEPESYPTRRRGSSRTQNSPSRQGRPSSQAGSDRDRTRRAAAKGQTGTGRREGAGRDDIGRDNDKRENGRRDNGRRTAGNTERGRAASGRQQGQMAKRRKKGRWKALILVLLAAFIGYGAWLFLHKPTGYWNVAVFGVDSRDGNTKNALADVQMICSINRSTGEIRLVSVYRDTYLKINSEGTYHKINEAYFKGGHKQGVAALEENLDLKIDDYAAFNWKAVAEAINILGGVDIEITPAEFKYINGFITETVNSTDIGSVQLTQAGMNHLDGVQAVAYSRLRLMDTDFQRTERQRKVVMLALEKAKAADAATLSSLAAYLIPQISTSVGVNDVLPLVKDIGKYHIGETGGFPFSRQTMRIGKMDCVVPTTLESNVVLLHQFLYGEETSYSPSSAVKKISAHISEETGLYEEGKAAPSGGSSGGSSDGGSSGSGQAPVQTAPAETPAETTAPPETTEESTEETEETDYTEEAEETEEVGPGVTDKPTKAPETTADPDSERGPGAEGPSGSETKPSATHPTKEPASETTKSPEPGTGPGDSGDSENSGGSGSGSAQEAPGGDSSAPGGPGV